MPCGGEAEALITDNRPKEALACCIKLNEIDPLNLSWQRRELALMGALKQPNEAIVAHARQLLDAHPQDSRSNTLMSFAYGMTGDKTNALKWLQTAAKLPPADAETDLQILSSLDDFQQIGLFDFLLGRAAAIDADPRLHRLMLQRLLEQQRYSELAEKLKDLDPKSPKTYPLLLGYRAIALYETGHKPQGNAVVATLKERGDELSSAWAGALRAQYRPGAPSPPPPPRPTSTPLNTTDRIRYFTSSSVTRTPGLAKPMKRSVNGLCRRD